MTVTGTNRVAETVSSKGARVGTGLRAKGSNGNGSRKNGGGGGDDGRQKQFSPGKYRVTLWIILAAVTMTFGALSYAYIALASGESWRPLRVPRLLWLSTALIVASSWTFKSARKALRRDRSRMYLRWLLVTLALGLAFLVSQVSAWWELSKQGVYLASNPHSSFFYVMTGAHGLHLLGGILGLNYLLVFRPSWAGADKVAELKARAAADAVSLYWHFMDALWVYLFLLLLLWRR